LLNICLSVCFDFLGHPASVHWTTAQLQIT